MRNVVPIVLLFLVIPAAAQVDSGTTVVLNILKDRVIVAADSRGTDQATKAHNNCECKITVFGNKTVFTQSGNNRRTAHFATDPVKSWDNADVAEEVFRRYIRTNGERRVHDIAEEWGDTVAAYWRVNRDLYTYASDPRLTGRTV